MPGRAHRAFVLACVLLLAALGCSATAPRTASERAAAAWIATPEDTAGVLVAHRAWWHAYMVADTAVLALRTSPALRLVLGSGLAYDRVATLAASATNVDGSRLAVEWGVETARAVAPGVALVTARAAESEGASRMHFRYLTVLERHERAWRVLAAQATREEAFTPRAADAASGGILTELAGEYRTPRGGVLRVEVEEEALVLIEPSGKRLAMEPIGPGLFEFRARSPLNGIVRFSFARDASGRVTSMSRLVAGGVTTFARVP